MEPPQLGHLYASAKPPCRTWSMSWFMFTETLREVLRSVRAIFLIFPASSYMVRLS
jgi:hypothetical protein